MSTKAIREALRELEHWRSAPPGRRSDVAAALGELAAIERAAKVLALCDVVYPYGRADAVDAATALIQAIAKEAP